MFISEDLDYNYNLEQISKQTNQLETADIEIFHKFFSVFLEWSRLNLSNFNKVYIFTY